ncbi:hypothetical protein PV325_011783 [Microctonus aethiopoides]|nr:hypothetical protein PV325_011783 [Microctonus aethiopoides]
MFGSRPINGLGGADLPRDIIDELQTEENLEKLINSMENKHEDENEAVESVDNSDNNYKNNNSVASKTVDDDNNNGEYNSNVVSDDEVDINFNYQLTQRNERILNERDKSNKMMKIPVWQII